MRELPSPCLKSQKGNQFSNILPQSFKISLFPFLASHYRYFKLAEFIFLYILMETAKVIDKVQILCSHTHTSTVKLYLYFLWYTPPPQTSFLSYTHTHTHTHTHIPSFLSLTDCSKGRGFPASLISSFYSISQIHSDKCFLGRE